MRQEAVRNYQVIDNVPHNCIELSIAGTTIKRASYDPRNIVSYRDACFVIRESVEDILIQNDQSPNPLKIIVTTKSLRSKRTWTWTN